MSRTTQRPLPIEDSYREMLRLAVEDVGRNRVAEVAKIDPSTVHRNVNDKALTYSTAESLREALAVLGRKLPPPLVPILDENHHQWYEIGTMLKEQFPSVFERMLDTARRELAMAKVLGEGNSAISNPLRSDTD